MKSHIPPLAPPKSGCLLLAREALTAGELSEARRLIEGVLASRDSDFAVLLELGLLQEAEGQLQEALNTWASAFELDPTAFVALRAMADLLASAGQQSEAFDMYQAVITSDPEDGASYLALGRILQQRGHNGRALRFLKEAITWLPYSVEAHILAGLAAQAIGQIESAQSYLESANELDPQDGAACHALGQVYLKQLRYPDAARLLGDAVAASPRNANWLAQWGQALSNNRDFEGAQHAIKEALALDPKNGLWRAFLASIRENSGDIEGAATEYRKLIELAPKTCAPYYRLARMGQLDNTAKIDELLCDTTISPKDISELQFAAGEILRRAGDYRESFERYTAANTAQGPNKAFNAQVQRRLTFSTIAHTPAECFASPSQPERGSDLIFILGMPRSGTSLIEQILAAQGSAHACGENMKIGELALRLFQGRAKGQQLGQIITALTDEQLAEMAAEYRASYDAPPTSKVIIDKSPGNYAHLALIARLFPAARIIHSMRHPLDTALSCYFTNFGSVAGAFAQDLEDIASVIECCRDYMAHWKRVLPNKILEVEYERVVTDIEEQAQRFVEFCGLDWNPACLQFHKLDRQVQTASRYQVREPVHSRSVGLWRNYKDWLGPLERLVEPGVS